MLENSLHVVVALFTVAGPSATSSHLVLCVISSGNRNLTDLHLRERTAGKFNRAVRHVLLTSWGPKSMFSGKEWLIPDPGSSATILYFSKTRIEPLRAPYSVTGTGWGWKEGHPTELYTGSLRPEAQPLNLLCTSFDRQGTPFWGGSRGGSGGSVEPPKLNVKTYNKRVVKKSEPTQLINIYLLKMIFLCVFVRENSNKNKTNLCLVENGL